MLIILRNILEADHVFAGRFYFLDSSASTLLDYETFTTAPRPIIIISFEDGDLLDTWFPLAPRRSELGCTAFTVLGA